MTSKTRRVMVAYYDSTAGGWVDLREAPWTGSSYDYYNASSGDTDTTHPSACVNFRMVDTLYTPMKATIRIKNQAAKPMAGSPGSAGSQGPWTDKVPIYSKIRVKDGQSDQVYFYGLVYDIQDNINAQRGSLTLVCYDMLKELEDTSGAAAKNLLVSGSHEDFYRAYDTTSATDARGYYGVPPTELTTGINDSVTSVIVEETEGIQIGTTIQIEDENMTVTAVNRATKTLTVATRSTGNEAHSAGSVVRIINEEPNSNSGIIKSIINLNTINIDTPSSTSDSTAENRFKDSTVLYNPFIPKALTGTTKPNDVVYNTGDENTSLLSNVQNLAVTDIHTAWSTSAPLVTGYTYYVDPNFQDAAASDETPQAFFNYFPKGYRPTGGRNYSAPTFTNTVGSTNTTPSNGTFDQGLNLYHPDLARTDAGKFTETGRMVPMTSWDFSKENGDDVISGLDVTYSEVIGFNGSEMITADERTDLFIYVEGNITNAGNLLQGFHWNKKATLPADRKSLQIELGNNMLINGSGNKGDSATTSGNNFSTDAGYESAEFLHVALTTLSSGINSSDTTLTVGSTAGFYVGQYIRLKNGSNAEEIMQIYEKTNATTLKVERGKNGVETAHTSSQDVYAYRVGRIQYVDKSGASDGSGGYNDISGAGMLISHVDEKVAKAHPDISASVYWQTSSPKTWLGEVSGSSFVLTYSPQNSHSLFRRATYKVRSNEHAEGSSSDIVRSQTYNALKRKSRSTIRGFVGTFRPPRYYFDDTIAAVDSVAQTQTLDLSGSTDPRVEGLTVGMVCNQLSGGAPSGVFGYITAVAGATVTVKWNTGSGVSAGAVIRFYVPVRAGDLIKVKNDIVDVDTIFTVTKVDYTEDNGVILTTYNVVGAQDHKRSSDLLSFKPSGVDISIPSGTANSSSGLADTPVFTNLKFTSVSATSLSWNAATISFGGETWNVDGATAITETTGPATSFTTGTTYVIYAIKGNRELRIVPEATYEARVSRFYDSNIIKIATAKSPRPSAGEFMVITVGRNVKGIDTRDRVSFSDLTAGGELDFKTAVTQDLTGLIQGNLTASATTFEVNNKDGTRPYYIGQEIIYNDEVMEVTSTTEGGGSNDTITVSRPNPIAHTLTGGTADTIKGTYNHGTFRPLQINDSFATAFYRTSISGSNILSRSQLLTMGTSVGTDFVAGGSLGNYANIQIQNGHVEIRSSTSGAYRIYWTSAGDGRHGSLFMASGFLYLEEADESDNYVGITANHDPNTYIRWNDSDELGFYSGGHKSFYTKATSAANGSIYVEGSYTWIDDPDTYIAAASDVMSFYAGSYRAAYITASSSSNGSIYVEDKYSWIDDTNTYITGTGSDQINFNTGGSLAARIDSSQNFRVEGTGAFIYSKGGYTFVDDDDTYITGSSDKIKFHTGGANLRVEIDSTGIRSEEGNNATPGWSFVADPNTGIYNTADTLNMTFGGTARVHFGNAAFGSIDADIYAIGDIEAGGDIKHGGSLISSDVSLKTNINDSVYGLDIIDKLKPKKYTAKYDNKTHLGLIAQEVKEVLPDLDVASGKEGSLALRYEELTAILIKSVQELKTEIDKLKEDK